MKQETSSLEDDKLLKLQMREAKEAIDLLNELRKAGIARGSGIDPFRPRQTLKDLALQSGLRSKSALVPGS